MQIIVSAFLLLFCLSLHAEPLRRVTGTDKNKEIAINVNFDRLNNAINNAVIKTTTQTITGSKIFVDLKASSTTATGNYLSIAGSFQTLPTSGYLQGTLAYQISDSTLYCSTETVSSANSWKALW